uniref:Si:dkey-30j10.5 n=1 Tax=Stegastes partitus TaxID=144197 RepID=A0A3B4Z3P6_9TELE
KGLRGIRIYIWYKTDGPKPITRIQFSFNDDMKMVLISANYNQITKNLNPGGNQVFLWYFTGSTEYDVPIVDLDVSTDDDAKKFKDGWERHACDLNQKAGGNWVYLWVKREKPMYVCDVTATFAKDGSDYFKNGYIQVDEDTNRGTKGPCIFIMYRKSTSPGRTIKDLQVSTNDDDRTKYKNAGYKQVTTNLNQGTTGNLVFLW